MKKFVLSVLLLCSLSGTALAGGYSYNRCDKVRIDDHSKDVTLTCEATDLSSVAREIADLRTLVATLPASCPTLTVPPCPVCPEVPACEPTSIEGTYQICKSRTNGKQKCKRFSVYKLFDEGNYDSVEKVQE